MGVYNMRNLFFVISIIFLLGALYLVFMNWGNYQQIVYAHKMISSSPTEISIVMKLSSYTMIVLFAGLFTGAGIVYMFLSATKAKVKAYERELEKTSITGQNNASKVDVLEAKIKTLEKAFNTVIDERTKLEVQIKSLNAELENLNRNKD